MMENSPGDVQIISTWTTYNKYMCELRWLSEAGPEEV